MAKNPLISVQHGRHGLVEHELTPSQLIGAVEAHMGIKVRLPFHSKADSILIEDDRVGVSYIKYDVTVLSRETRYNGAERVLDVYTHDAGVWSRTDRFSAIDDTFTPHAVHEAATEHRDEAAQRQRRMFEGDCYRPGASRFPMDNAQRTAEGYTTTKMERHWL